MEGYHDNDKMQEVDSLIDSGDNDMETQEFDVESEVANYTGLNFLRQVQTTPERTMTNS